MLVAVAAVAAVIGFLLATVRARLSLGRARTELEAARRLAEQDALTGLLNRSGLERRHRQLAAAGTPAAAVLLDLDDFKQVNDTWGHQAGDAQLAVVADCLETVCARSSAVAGRLAGDEFLILLPGATETDAVAAASAFFDLLSRPTVLPVGEGETVTVIPTASAGISLPERGSGWTDLLRRADIALYHAKLQRGHAKIHTPGMRQPDRRTGRSRPFERRDFPASRGRPAAMGRLAGDLVTVSGERVPTC